jgi:hypothetical protein
VRAGSTAVINATEVGLDGVPPNSMFGDRATQEIDQAETPEAAVAGTKVFETMAAITRVRGRKRA